MEDLETRYDSRQGQQLAFFDKVERDDSVILDGSTADYGCRLGELSIEIWEYKVQKSGLTYELYPIDGKDQPVLVQVSEHRHLDELLPGLVHAAFLARKSLRI